MSVHPPGGVGEGGYGEPDPAREAFEATLAELGNLEADEAQGRLVGLFGGKDALAEVDELLAGASGPEEEQAIIDTLSPEQVAGLTDRQSRTHQGRRRAEG